MWRKILHFKGTYLLVIMMCFALGSGVTVFAQNVNEEEPNDTLETAQLIQANRETLADAVSANKKPNQYAVSGYTDKDDSDWYKVYLSAGEQYVSLNADAPLEFEVYNANQSLIMRRDYTKTKFGVTAYKMDVSEGYYYVRIVGTLLSPKEYHLMVGDPSTTISSCKVNLGTVTMSNKRNQTVDFNLEEQAQLPENAVVYEIRTERVNAVSASKVAVTNSRAGVLVNLRPYTFSETDLLGLNMPLKSRWSVEFGYYKNTSFTPSITFYYAYPIVSQMVDEVTITP